MTRVETIGDATLYLGDCRDVLDSLDDGSIDLIFTDPSYGHNNNNNDESDPRPIQNDGEEANPLIQEVLPKFNRVLSPGCCCCCCCGGGPDPQFARWSLWIDDAIGFKQMVVWDKGPMGMGWHYRRSYETVLVAEKPGAACRWFDDSGRIENVIRPGMYGIKKIIPAADDHPTPKPIELPAHFIRLHSQPRHTVLDPFMGGCSTGEAAIRLGRKFIGIEIDEEHFERSILRLEQFVRQPDLFIEQPAPKAEQEALAL